MKIRTRRSNISRSPTRPVQREPDPSGDRRERAPTRDRTPTITTSSAEVACADALVDGDLRQPGAGLRRDRLDDDEEERAEQPPLVRREEAPQRERAVVRRDPVERDLLGAVLRLGVEDLLRELLQLRRDPGERQPDARPRAGRRRTSAAARPPNPLPPPPHAHQRTLTAVAISTSTFVGRRLRRFRSTRRCLRPLRVERFARPLRGARGPRAYLGSVRMSSA